MSVRPEVWGQATRHARVRVASLRHARYYKLGKEAKDIVLSGAVACLMAPDAVFPYALRKRLNPRRVGNITLRNVDPELWKAWLTVYENYIVAPGGFWFEPTNEATNELVDRALDNSRIAYCSATADSGDIDPDLLERFSEAGQMYARTPEREHEREKRVEDFDAALEQRRQEVEAEFAKLKLALKAYRKKLRCPKQKRAFGLIVTEGKQMTGAAIAAKCKISEGIVSKHRAAFDEMTERFFALYNTAPEEGASTPEVPTTAVVHDETVTQIAEAGEVEGGALDLATTVHAPEVDADAAESVMRGYARSMSGGRRNYSEQLLVTGNSGRKPNAKDYAKMSKPADSVDRTNHERRFANTAARHLQRKAKEAGHDVDGALQIIDEYLAVARADVVALMAVRRAEVLRIEKLAGLEWIEPWCKAQRVSENDLLGTTDTTLASTVVPKKSA